MSNRLGGNVKQPQPEDGKWTPPYSNGFERFLQPAMAGARGASAATARQMVMRAEEFDVHIKVWGDHDRTQLRGQLSRHNAHELVQSAQFHLLRDGAMVESTATDESGEFYFSDVPEGDLGFQISLPHLTVVGPLRFQEAH